MRPRLSCTAKSCGQLRGREVCNTAIISAHRATRMFDSTSLGASANGALRRTLFRHHTEQGKLSDKRLNQRQFF